MKTHLGGGGLVPQILNLGTYWRYMVTFTPRSLPRGKDPGTQWIDSWVCPRARSEGGGEDKNYLISVHAGNRSSVVHPVADRITPAPTILTNLYKSQTSSFSNILNCPPYSYITGPNVFNLVSRNLKFTAFTQSKKPFFTTIRKTQNYFLNPDIQRFETYMVYYFSI
jgi:hypothetical protein